MFVYVCVSGGGGGARASPPFAVHFFLRWQEERCWLCLLWRLACFPSTWLYRIADVSLHPTTAVVAWRDTSTDVQFVFRILRVCCVFYRSCTSIIVSGMEKYNSRLRQRFRLESWLACLHNNSSSGGRTQSGRETLLLAYFCGHPTRVQTCLLCRTSYKARMHLCMQQFGTVAVVWQES